ncbi:MAG: hypothetical protein C0622_03610 [Desulfuromonas sp.]|nr:MAG: hypothetical protein C0622_03610 [Desulfuromonas sp.]
MIRQPYLPGILADTIAHDKWDFRHFIRNLRPRILLWLRNAQTRRQLAELPAYLCRDIGLSERQVRQEADKPFWR